MTTDAVLAAAHDVARAALLEATDESTVGDHLRVVDDGERLATHLFACTGPGYRGWTWAVSLSAAIDDGAVSVNDVVLLPGDDAVVAPAWTPYRDRIQPGDLSPGDLLPPEEDDARLVPSWSAGDHLETVDRAFAREVGLGRPWVLSLEGRDLAAQRWHDGDQGPDTPLAQQAPGTCHSCGFLVSLAGPLADRFGVCANGSANDDGRVVSFEHGCGAHSGARLSRSAGPQKLPPPVWDTIAVDGLETS
ncbi:DUF3027 domain-containing protein [Aeromicrobium sp.]|uniref:DUF3027 domain-containing protein n=1 Tax=Aeromicrobium sp. TaxID=1871063 RepID=UPI0010EA6FC8|nr:MAG: DUF3027 domain-containing protein [Actinomycetales bacterium]